VPLVAFTKKFKRQMKRGCPRLESHGQGTKRIPKRGVKSNNPKYQKAEEIDKRKEVWKRKKNAFSVIKDSDRK